MKFYKIYCLKHPETLEVRYVGVTSNSIKNRLYQHIYSAKHRRGTRVSKWIYSLIKQDLLPLIEVLEIVSEDFWEEREIYWISKFSNLTNISKEGKGVVINRTYNSIERSTNAKKKPIIQLGENGEFIKEWNSIKEATIALNLKTLSSISNVVNRRHGAVRAGGYKWAYKEEYYRNDFQLNKDKPKVDYSKLKKVSLYDLEGNFIKEYPCLNQLVKELSPGLLNYTAARKAIKNQTKFKQHFIKYSESI